jgi:GT2 family glycosyltransferase
VGKIKIYMGIPSTGTREDSQNYVLRRLEKEYGDRYEFVYPEVCVSRIFHDFARNAVVDDFLASDCDVLWFLDSDVIPHRDIMSLFDKYEEWELAGAPYPVFMKPAGYDNQQVVFTIYKEHDGKYLTANIPEKGTEYVDGIATGCIFIKRSVFEGLQKPYFDFKYDPETRRMVEGEDIGFCRKVNALGKKFYTDYALLCNHYKKVGLLDVNNYAVEFANRSIQTYDANLRSLVARRKLGL